MGAGNRFLINIFVYILSLNRQLDRFTSIPLFLRPTIRHVPVVVLRIRSESLKSHNTRELREKPHRNNRVLVVFFENTRTDLHGTKTLHVMNATNASVNVE